MFIIVGSYSFGLTLPTTEESKEKQTTKTKVSGSLKFLFAFHSVNKSSCIWFILGFVDEASKEESLEDEEEGDEPSTAVEMNWDLVKYFPEDPPCQEYFNTVVATYISAIYDHMMEAYGDRLPGATPVRRIQSSQTQRLKIGQVPESLKDFCRNLIDQEIAQHLFRITQKIHKQLHDHNAQNSSLEFVKAVVRVFQLDPNIEEEVIRLRRNLLKLIGVGEFSPEAEWKDAFMSYVLPEVICPTCNHCRDIDLCRDPHESEERGV